MDFQSFEGLVAIADKLTELERAWGGDGTFHFDRRVLYAEIAAALDNSFKAKRRYSTKDTVKFHGVT